MTILTYIWNGSLHRWRVDRSNKYCWKQFLNLNHWIQNPKSREHNKNTWFVVGIRTRPVTEPLKKLTVLKLKDNSYLILQSKHVHSQIDTQGTKDFLPLENCMHRRYVMPHQRTHTNGLDQPAQIHQAQIGTLSCQYFQIPIYIKKLSISKHSMIVFTSSTSTS